MKYYSKEITIQDLVRLIDNNNIDLNPPYQRNFIWSTVDQSDLIDTIIKGWPLPSFFIYEKSNGKFEMVDGQQRSKTIYSFSKGIITSSKKTNRINITNLTDFDFFNYNLSVIFLSNISNQEDLREFYVLINKKGKLLNAAEVHKSEFFNSNFMKLANEVLSYQNFINLNLFTDALSRRLNDRDYVQELLGYLYLGIKDKKKHIETIFENDIDESEYESLKENFIKIIDIINELNNYYPIKSTRFKQKNDFYTFFSFINENSNLSFEVLLHQYKILLILDGKDDEGRQHIRPTNDACISLKQYAINCVSQSNSKNARQFRLSFFNNILKNEEIPPNESLIEVLEYLLSIEPKKDIKLKSIGKFELLDVEQYNKFS